MCAKLHKSQLLRKKINIKYRYFHKKVSSLHYEWLEQVTILDLLVKGFVIGVVVSAPLGPVGVLCIQRTLNKGRWFGFVTGLGAALSDIGYSLITGLRHEFHGRTYNQAPDFVADSR